MARPRLIADERLVSAAAAVIGRRGPAFTLAQVGREAGVAAGTLVGRFGSRHGLLLAVARGSTAGTVAAMRAVAPRDPHAVREALVAAAAGLDDPRSAANHLAQLHADLADPELREAVGAHQRAVRAEVRRLVARAPGLPGAPAPGRAAEALVDLWSGALLDWSLSPEGTLAARVRRALDVLLDAWRAGW